MVSASKYLAIFGTLVLSTMAVGLYAQNNRVLESERAIENLRQHVARLDAENNRLSNLIAARVSVIEGMPLGGIGLPLQNQRPGVALDDATLDAMRKADRVRMEQAAAMESAGRIGAEEQSRSNVAPPPGSLGEMILKAREEARNK